MIIGKVVFHKVWFIILIMRIILLLLSIFFGSANASDIYRHNVTSPIIGCIDEDNLLKMAQLHTNQDLKAMVELIDEGICDNFAKYAALFTSTGNPCKGKSIYDTAIVIRPYDRKEFLVYCGSFGVAQ